MFEEFIEIARQITGTRVKKLAERFNDEHIGTDHLLLALLEAKDVVVTAVLVNRGFSPDKIKDELKAVMIMHPDACNLDPKLTPRSVKVLEFAISEAAKMGSHVGPEHLLLGIMLEREGVAAQVLSASGLTVDGVRDEIMAIFENRYRSGRELAEKAKEEVILPSVNILMYMTTKINWYEARRSINNVVKKLNLTGARTTLVTAASTSCDDGHTIPYLVVRGTDWEKIHLVAEELGHLNFLIEVEQITKIIEVKQPKHPTGS